MGTLFFVLIFYGGTSIGGPTFDRSLDGIVVGYFLWAMTTVSYRASANDITNEAQWGTLERHFMTPFGFGPVIFAKSVGTVLRSFIDSFVILLVMLLLTGTSLVIDVLTIIPITVFGLASVLGVGFAVGGVAVLYKQVGNWINLLQFGFIGLIAAPTFDVVWLKLLPLTQSSALLQRAMTDGVRIWEFDPIELTVLVLTTVFYLGFGYIVFYAAHRRARRLGVLGDY
jgi:ABC-2 type transport system permease protein